MPVPADTVTEPTTEDDTLRAAIRAEARALAPMLESIEAVPAMLTGL